MARIRKLELRSFRGVRSEVALIFDSKSILLFGENGTGKSSFVDALEKILTGRVSALDGRGAGVSSDKHGPNIRLNDFPSRIILVFEDDSGPAVDLVSDRSKLPRDVRAYLDGASEN